MNARSNASFWNKCRKLPPEISSTGGGFLLKKFNIPCANDAARGSTILFFSDCHIKTAQTTSGSWFSRRKIPWSGLDFMAENIHEAISATSPDYIIYGGDLVTHSCWLDDAMSFMAGLKAKKLKISVPGNWDKRRRRWMPHAIWDKAYRQAGFTMLCNEELIADGIRFMGMDDNKLGIPKYLPATNKQTALFNCVITHNPDAVPFAMSDDDIKETDLILCGHTHGGQIRLPLFGALKTSSEHWKKFEQGMYDHRTGRAKMIVSSGMGSTFLNVRINCPPEIIVMTLV